jgi:hypothetical protein
MNKIAPVQHTGTSNSPCGKGQPARIAQIRQLPTAIAGRYRKRRASPRSCHHLTLACDLLICPSRAKPGDTYIDLA